MLRVTLAGLILVLVTGCSGGGGSTTNLSPSSPGTGTTTGSGTTPTTPSSTPAAVDGSWTALAMSSTGQLTTTIVQFQGTQAQLTGQMQVIGDNAFDPTKSFTGTGSIDSTGKLSFSGTQGQETLSIFGTPSTDASTFSGTYKASGTTAKTGTITAVHPPSMTGTYNASYSDSFLDASVTGSLTLTAGTPAAGSFLTPITGTAQASSPSLSFCGYTSNSLQLQFTGSQVGSGLNGFLSLGTTQWGQLTGTLSPDGSALTGTLTITDPNAGLCSGLSFDGTVTSATKAAQTGTPSTTAQGITLTIVNEGPDSGSVYINGQTATCPAVPKGITGGLSCGQIIVPAGAEEIQIEALADSANDYTLLNSPCAVGGASVVSPGLPAFCTWPPVPISDIGTLPGETIGALVTTTFQPSPYTTPVK